MVLLAATAIAQGVPQREEGLGSIAGTLLGRDGRPAADVRVMAISHSNDPGLGEALISIARTDAKGHFVLESVPPGRYLVATGILSAPSYYPGVASRKEAQTVTVASGQAVTGADFRVVVPSSVRVSGRIIREDGLPLSPLEPGLPSASVSLRPEDGGGTYVERTDENGGFVFRGISPGPYTLGASAGLTRIADEENDAHGRPRSRRGVRSLLCPGHGAGQR
jgi:hypothetical protein